ncbi:MAG TPA: glycosyltransferase [Limnochordales bacterium]
MRILYLSCHTALEYDELRLFAEMGHQVFALGTYLNPHAPTDDVRPPLPLPRYPVLEAIARGCSQARVDRRLVAWADLVLVMHIPQWVTNNWHLFRGKRVVWRSIGQSTPAVEAALQPYRRLGLEVVRHSPRELFIPRNIGADAVIRFYKDPEEFTGWTGHTDEVMCVNQSMPIRAAACNFAAFVTLAHGFRAHVYGRGNEGAGVYNGGPLSYDQLKQKLREARVYIHAGTKPACYTLGLMEAMMTGIPVVALGPCWGDPGWGTYEVHEIIRDGVDGFVSDDLAYLKQAIQRLLDDPELAARIGRQGRLRAIELFGKAAIMAQWAALLSRPHPGVRVGRSWYGRRGRRLRAPWGRRRRSWRVRRRLAGRVRRRWGGRRRLLGRRRPGRLPARRLRRLRPRARRGRV